MHMGLLHHKLSPATNCRPATICAKFHTTNCRPTTNCRLFPAGRQFVLHAIFSLFDQLFELSSEKWTLEPQIVVHYTNCRPLNKMSSSYSRVCMGVFLRLRGVMRLSLSSPADPPPNTRPNPGCSSGYSPAEQSNFFSHGYFTHFISFTLFQFQCTVKPAMYATNMMNAKLDLSLHTRGIALTPPVGLSPARFPGPW